MEFRLLGPVEVWSDGRQVPLGGAKPRTLLTALLLDEGHVVRAERLIEAACYTASPDILPEAAGNRRLLASVLTAVGLVNYPTEWWHWSYGDRYWAYATGAPTACYGLLQAPAPVD